MIRLWAACGLAAWVGATLLLAEWRRVRRPSLATRLRPYAATGQAPVRAEAFSLDSVRAVLGPLARDLGSGLARSFGVGEELERRLARVHSSLDPTAFRLRQLAWSLAAFGAGAAIDLAAAPPLAVGLLLVLGSPLLSFLLLEQRLASASAAWQRRLVAELPVVAEQLAMLLGAGLSLRAALTRLAARAHGAAGADLSRVCQRIAHGLSEPAALSEWAEVAGVGALSRLVPILGLHSETAEIGRLVSEEAQAIRRDIQRGVVEVMERRGQQVWIPVTVAALVPGVIFLAVPFIQALHAFTLGS